MRAYFLLWLLLAGSVPMCTVTSLAAFRPDYLMTLTAQFCKDLTEHFFIRCHVASVCFTLYAMMQSCFAALVCDLLPLYFALTFNSGFDEINAKLKLLTHPYEKEQTEQTIIRQKDLSRKLGILTRYGKKVFHCETKKAVLILTMQIKHDVCEATFIGTSMLAKGFA